MTKCQKNEWCYEKNGLIVTRLSTKGSDFFPILRFKVEIQGEKPRIDKVDSSKELEKFMYLTDKENLAKAYYEIIL
jgi:hypothetical protein